MFELCPVPQPVPEIPAIYRRVAADPRPVRVLERAKKTVFSIGDYTARSQYFQTLHGKKLIGGYLSRISQRRVADMRRQPTLDALLALSEGRELSDAEQRRIRERAPRFLQPSNLGYVIIDHARASPGLTTFVVDAWRLVEMERAGPFGLYRPTLLVTDAVHQKQ